MHKGEKRLTSKIVVLIVVPWGVLSMLLLVHDPASCMIAKKERCDRSVQSLVPSRHEFVLIK